MSGPRPHVVRTAVGAVVLGLAAIAGSGCGPLRLSLGLGPEGRLVELLQDRQGQFLRVDGKEQPSRHFRIAPKSVVLSGDGRRVAYAARDRRGGWTVVYGGREGSRWDGIGGIVLNQDGQHLAYAADQGGRWYVVHDQRRTGPWPAVLQRSMHINGDGNAHAFVVKDGQSSAVVVNGRVGPAYDGVAQLGFSDDGRHIAYLARRGPLAFPVIDGVEHPGTFDAVADLVLAGRSDGTRRVGFLGRRGDHWHAVVDGVEGAAWDSIEGIRFSPDGARIAYVGRRNRLRIVVLDGVAGEAFERIDAGSLAFSADGVHLVYRIRRNGRAAVVRDGVEGPLFDEVDAPVMTGVRWGYIGHRDHRSFVVLDGKAQLDCDWAGDLVLRGDHFAYLAEQRSQQRLVHDGRAHQIDIPVAGTVVLSNDGTHAACLTATTSRRLLRVIVDGMPSRTVDFGDIVDVATQEGDVLFASPRTLRALVAAELRRTLGQQPPVD